MIGVSDPHLPAQLLKRLEAFYDQLDEKIASHQPICRNRGACCRFDSYGHRLFVTGLEMHWFLHHHADAVGQLAVQGGASETACTARPAVTPHRLPVLKPDKAAGCPFQQHGQCTTRIGRPVGCRVFFCESEREGWQGELSEWALAQLKQFHQDFASPYTYTEWLRALQNLEIPEPPNS